ncbi:MAG: hypothetical protein K6C08_01290 [Oscillospiraceae bacterium]|nr:hypothetical protein [Oscillospiraceae bacterium]
MFKNPGKKLKIIPPEKPMRNDYHSDFHADAFIDSGNESSTEYSDRL